MACSTCNKARAAFRRGQLARGVKYTAQGIYQNYIQPTSESKPEHAGRYERKRKPSSTNQ